MSTEVPSTNRATLTYRITFKDGREPLAGKIERVSGGTGNDDNYYGGEPEPKGLFEGKYMHDRDSEKQVINFLADKVFAQLGCKTDKAEEYRAAILAQVDGGSIELSSDMGPCHSCRAVLREFVKDYPMISCVVTYRQTDGRGNRTRALTLAGGDLRGSYGYGDAVEDNGNWSKKLQ